MSMVRCESVTDGLRASEAVAHVRDLNGRRHSIRVERAFLDKIDGCDFLPIGVVGVDPRTGYVLVEFPQPPETGFNRMWIEPAQLDRVIDIYGVSA